MDLRCSFLPSRYASCKEVYFVIFIAITQHYGNCTVSTFSFYLGSIFGFSMLFRLAKKENISDVSETLKIRSRNIVVIPKKT